MWLSLSLNRNNLFKMIDLMDVCRLCMSKIGLLRIFDVKSTMNLKNVIMITTSVEISETDAISQQVCSKCKDLTFKIYDFRKRAIRIDRNLKARLKQLEGNEGTNLKEETEPFVGESAEEVIITSGKNVECLPNRKSSCETESIPKSASINSHKVETNSHTNDLKYSTQNKVVTKDIQLLCSANETSMPQKGMALNLEKITTNILKNTIECLPQKELNTNKTQSCCLTQSISRFPKDASIKSSNTLERDSECLSQNKLVTKDIQLPNSKKVIFPPQKSTDVNSENIMTITSEKKNLPQEELNTNKTKSRCSSKSILCLPKDTLINSAYTPEKDLESSLQNKLITKNVQLLGSTEAMLTLQKVTALNSEKKLANTSEKESLPLKELNANATQSHSLSESISNLPKGTLINSANTPEKDVESLSKNKLITKNIQLPGSAEAMLTLQKITAVNTEKILLNTSEKEYLPQKELNFNKTPSHCLTESSLLKDALINSANTPEKDVEFLSQYKLITKNIQLPRSTEAILTPQKVPAVNSEKELTNTSEGEKVCFSRKKLKSNDIHIQSIQLLPKEAPISLGEKINTYENTQLEMNYAKSSCCTEKKLAPQNSSSILSEKNSNTQILPVTKKTQYKNVHPSVAKIFKQNPTIKLLKTWLNLNFEPEIVLNKNAVKDFYQNCNKNIDENADEEHSVAEFSSMITKHKHVPSLTNENGKRVPDYDIVERETKKLKLNLLNSLQLMPSSKEYCSECNDNKLYTKGMLEIHFKLHLKCKYCTKKFRTIKRKKKHDQKCAMKQALKSRTFVLLKKVDYLLEPSYNKTTPAVNFKYQSKKTIEKTYNIEINNFTNGEATPNVQQSAQTNINSVNLNLNNSHILNCTTKNTLNSQHSTETNFHSYKLVSPGNQLQVPSEIFTNTQRQVFQNQASHPISCQQFKPDIRIESSSFNENFENQSWKNIMKQLLETNNLPVNKELVEKDVQTYVNPCTEIYLMDNCRAMIKEAKSYLETYRIPVEVEIGNFNVSYKDTKVVAPRECYVWDCSKKVDLVSNSSLFKTADFEKFFKYVEPPSYPKPTCQVISGNIGMNSVHNIPIIGPNNRFIGVNNAAVTNVTNNMPQTSNNYFTSLGAYLNNQLNFSNIPQLPASVHRFSPPNYTVPNDGLSFQSNVNYRAPSYINLFAPPNISLFAPSNVSLLAPPNNTFVPQSVSNPAENTGNAVTTRPVNMSEPKHRPLIRVKNISDLK